MAAEWRWGRVPVAPPLSGPEEPMAAEWRTRGEARGLERVCRATGEDLKGSTKAFQSDFNQPNICWKDDSAGHKHTRRFLECVDDSFLLQVMEEPMRRGVLLNLVLSYKEDLMRNVNLKGGVGCSDHEVVKILRTMRKMHSKLATLDFRRAELALFGDVVGRVPWNKALEGRGA
ncbi:hypothetical protein TURU_054333 [Turdus rufiventris]|nr:hypothetical protein TURU_054333 [Turdus rufiventris]